MFSFFFVLPFALNFLISYGVNAGFIPQLSIAQYVGFALWFLMVFGLIFEVPLVITLLAKLGWVDAPLLKRYRKWAFLAVVYFRRDSDADAGPFNQCLMALPMYIFYEVGIFERRDFQQEKNCRCEQAGVPGCLAGAGPAAATSGHAVPSSGGVTMNMSVCRRPPTVVLDDQGDDETSSSFHPCRFTLYESLRMARELNVISQPGSSSGGDACTYMWACAICDENETLPKG